MDIQGAESPKVSLHPQRWFPVNAQKMYISRDSKLKKKKKKAFSGCSNNIMERSTSILLALIPISYSFGDMR